MYEKNLSEVSIFAEQDLNTYWSMLYNSRRHQEVLGAKICSLKYSATFTTAPIEV